MAIDFELKETTAVIVDTVTPVIIPLRTKWARVVGGCVENTNSIRVVFFLADDLIYSIHTGVMVVPCTKNFEVIQNPIDSVGYEGDPVDMVLVSFHDQHPDPKIHINKI